MKKLVSALLTCAALVSGAFAQRGGEFEITKVAPQVVPTPEYNFTGTPHRSPRSNWLEVEVEFTARPEFSDELTVRYFIRIAGQCLTGEVTHVNVAAGRELKSVMYVAPGTLNRLMNGKALNPASIEDVGVQLLRRGQVLSTKSFKAPGDTQWWQSVPQQQGYVLNKSETPFAPLYWDRYEAIKSNVR